MSGEEEGEGAGRGWEARTFEGGVEVEAVERGVGGGKGKKGEGGGLGELVEVRVRVAPLEGREGEGVGRVKVVSVGRKGGRVEVCGWGWDEWQI